MKSEDKFKIEIKPVYGKEWVLMVFPRPERSFMPSFEDIGRLLRAIAPLEDATYPPEEGYMGREMMARYMEDAIMTDIPFAELGQRYQVPDRTK